MTDKGKIIETAHILKGAQKLVVLTGAGVSKESGIPTFRDALEGLWAKFDPQELATPQAFRRNPKQVWEWYTYRRNLAAQAEPNPGHIALAQLEQYHPQLVVITQNIDDLHEQAGSHDVIHLHGKLMENRCFKECRGYPTIITAEQIADDEHIPPHCPYCGEYVRPNVVWFGEMLPAAVLERAQDLAFHCDVMLVIGTSGLVTPAASLPLWAKQQGANIVEVNPDDSMITRYANIKLDGPSGEIIPKVLEAMSQIDDT